MDHRVQELARFRTRFFLVTFAARTNRWNHLIIDTFGPYHIHHLDKLAGYFDVTAITIFPAAVGCPVKNSTPFAAGTNRAVGGLDKGPLKRTVTPEAKVTALWRVTGIVLAGIICARRQKTVAGQGLVIPEPLNLTYLSSQHVSKYQAEAGNRFEPRC